MAPRSNDGRVEGGVAEPLNGTLRLILLRVPLNNIKKPQKLASTVDLAGHQAQIYDRVSFNEQESFCISALLKLLKEYAAACKRKLKKS